MIDRACLSLTSKCQLSCKYCHFDKHIEKSSCSDMTYDELETILKNILDYTKTNNSCLKIGLVGAGEPLRRFDLIKQCIDFLKVNDSGNAISLYTITNGVVCSEEILSYFYEHRNVLKLCFSLDGNEKVHNFCRQFKNGSGSFSHVMKSIEMYKKIFNQPPAINATVHKKSIENADEVLKFFEGNFSEVTFSRLVDEKSTELFISRADFDSFMKKAKKTKLTLRQCRIPQKYDCTMYGQLCGVGRTNIFYANGNIYPCGRFINLDEFVLGKYSDSLSKIEQKMKRFSPCENGECYFDKNVTGEIV